jgi:hypothetical protein
VNARNGFKSNIIVYLNPAGHRVGQGILNGIDVSFDYETIEDLNLTGFFGRVYHPSFFYFESDSQITAILIVLK